MTIHHNVFIKYFIERALNQMTTETIKRKFTIWETYSHYYQVKKKSLWMVFQY